MEPGSFRTPPSGKKKGKGKKKKKKGVGLCVRHLKIEGRKGKKHGAFLLSMRVQKNIKGGEKLNARGVASRKRIPRQIRGGEKYFDQKLPARLRKPGLRGIKPNELIQNNQIPRQG